MKTKKVELWELFETGQKKNWPFEDLVSAGQRLGFTRDEVKSEHDLFANKRVKMGRKVW